jgi:hypothetical protein
MASIHVPCQAHRTAAGAPSKVDHEDSLLWLCNGDQSDGGEVSRPPPAVLCTVLHGVPRGIAAHEKAQRHRQISVTVMHEP